MVVDEMATWVAIRTNSGPCIVNTLRQKAAISQTILSNAFSWMETFKSQIIFQWNMFQWVKNTCLTTIVSKIQSTCFIWTIRTCIRRFPIWIRFNFLWGDDWELFDLHRHAWIMLQQNNMCNSSWDRYLIRVKYVARVLACVTFAAT